MPASFRRWSAPGLGVSAIVLMVAAGTAVPRAGGVSAQAAVDLGATLERATARVEDFFLRAQSLVCTETVHVQPLNYSLGGEGFGRTIESELRLSWDPGRDGDGATEATAVRNVTRVNGHAPRKNDRNNCTTPERHETETQVLSMLLGSQRDDYTWALAGTGKVDNRLALLLDFREKERLSMEVSVKEDDEDCMSFEIRGGGRGRVWLDAESHDVLRLDQGLAGQVSAPLPKVLLRRPGTGTALVVERYEMSYRFRRVRFDDPEETLVLPVSSTSLRVTHGAGTPRVRVTTEYKKYRRFLTGGRVVPGD